MDNSAYDGSHMYSKLQQIKHRKIKKNYDSVCSTVSVRNNMLFWGILCLVIHHITPSVAKCCNNKHAWTHTHTHIQTHE